jgi:hypothetical protein
MGVSFSAITSTQCDDSSLFVSLEAVVIRGGYEPPCRLLLRCVSGWELYVSMIDIQTSIVSNITCLYHSTYFYIAYNRMYFYKRSSDLQNERW